MSRQYYHDLARRNLRMPIGTDLVLREKPDQGAILLDGERLGDVLIESARRYDTPLAIHLMDLMIEKAELLAALGIPAEQAEIYQFTAPPADDAPARLKTSLEAKITPRLSANVRAVARVASAAPDLVPVGMSIGPFSLMSKLLLDPITPVFMAGSGATAADDPEIHTVEQTLELAIATILHAINLQIDAGARAILVAEPAANKAYFSPNQLAAGADIFERYAMAFNRRIKAMLDSRGVDLIFHCCGEITDQMLKAFTALDPVMLSLGSSRRLWEDAKLVPESIVLYGNLPTKKFYSDTEMPVSKVRELTREIAGRMRATGHPFVLGSECDVLSVAGSEQIIREKVDAMMTTRLA
ncbi:MAG: uroporphyrinogen decarboxylase family protein [Tepidisphaeraceae bacterium]